MRSSCDARCTAFYPPPCSVYSHLVVLSCRARCASHTLGDEPLRGRLGLAFDLSRFRLLSCHLRALCRRVQISSVARAAAQVSCSRSGLARTSRLTFELGDNFLRSSTQRDAKHFLETELQLPRYFAHTSRKLHPLLSARWVLLGAALECSFPFPSCLSSLCSPHQHWGRLGRSRS